MTERSLNIVTMKNIITLLLLMVTTGTMAQSFNVITYNIRLNTSSDGINAWPNRKEMVTALLRFHEAAIFGLQEAKHEQILDLEERMPHFGRLGSGRDDGQTGGEYSPVFYDRGRFKLLESGQFWLSETPEFPSKGWDAALPRIVTWGKFKVIGSSRKFFFFNTHFDHVGKVARANSSRLILEKIAALNPSHLPVIVTGDFNLTPESEPISLIMEKLRDSYVISASPPYGPVGTFNSFRRDHPLDQRIDYIFVNDKVKVEKYGVLTDGWDNRWPSDHQPVLVRIRL